jgi:hypothetical protein
MRSLILSVILSGAFTVSAEQILPDEMHCTPVLIEIPLHDNICDYGTGVFIGESNKIFLVTAAHVIFNFNSTNKLELQNSKATLYAFKYGKDSTDKNVTFLDLKKLMDEGFVRRYSTHDVAVIQLGKSIPTGTNNISQEFFENGVNFTNDSSVDLLLAGSNCRKFNDIQDGSEAYILGYPVELLNTNIQAEVDFSYPLIRKGIISQRNLKTGKLIIDSGVYGGNSGGPVIIIEHPFLDRTTYKIGGLITQFVPVMTRIVPQIGVTNSDLVNSGYGVAEPIDYALQLMRQ